MVSYSLWSVVFSILLLVGMAVVFAGLFKNKTIPVTLTLGNDCVLINDPTQPRLLKLIPLKVEQKDERRIFVERRGSFWELKRLELSFASAEDTSKAFSMLRNFPRNT